MPFVANQGQTDAAVAFYAPTLAGTVFVTRNGRIVYSLPGKGPGRPEKPARRPGAAASVDWSLTEAPVGATGIARPVVQRRAQTQVSYFLGNDPSAWTSGIATYEEVSLGQVWPGVTLSLRAHGKNVEKVFTVEPGGDPSRIRMRVSGARSLKSDEAGGLIASTGPGDVRLTRPAAYQDHGGKRRSISVDYAARGDIYGFLLGGYDPGLPLVIDPLVQATYLGGTGTDITQALAIHSTSGDVYVAGYTSSTNFPGTTGGARPSNGGGNDAVVARLTADLKTLTQATYLGGSGDEIAYALAIHPTSGDVYVTGVTSSTSFPGTTGGAQPTFGGGGGDGFVARLTADLKTLTQATYLGGSNHELPNALAIHPTSGDVYVAGSTDSANFPGTTGGAQALFADGFFDAFAVRLTADLKTLTQATYLGTAGDDRAFALAIHPASGDVYVAGYTTSTNFNGGANDGFVARLNASLTTLIRATLLGGNGEDQAFALAIHPTSGEVYVAGYTTSTNFPGTIGGARPAYGGGGDAFVARLTADLTTLSKATYLGGSGSDAAQALAIYPTFGDVYVTGYTASTNFPGTAGGAQATNAGGFDAFVARLTADLSTLTQATYLGGSASDFAYALAIHPASGDVYAAGYTSSTNFPGTAGGARPANGGGNDALVARLTPDLVFTPGPAATAFFPVTPCRLLDTRDPAGPLGGPALAAGAQRSFPLTGTCGIPAGARALSLNVTITSSTAAGDLKLFAAGTSVPVATAVSYRAGQTRANNAIAAPSSSGNLAVFCNQPSGTAHLVVDVNGYFR